MRSNGHGRGKARIAALGAACAIGVTGLVLAVGAGADSGKSVRDASYPVSYAYAIKITDSPKAKVVDAAKGKATFKFHIVYKTTGQKPPHIVLKSLRTSCKLDKAKAHKCDSPKTYNGLSKGRHTFKVRAEYKTNDAPASAWKKNKFKIG